MPIITIIVVLILIGVGLWALNTYVPMDQKIKTVINVLIVILVVLWLLSVLGVLSIPFRL